MSPRIYRIFWPPAVRRPLYGGLARLRARRLPASVALREADAGALPNALTEVVLTSLY